MKIIFVLAMVCAGFWTEPAQCQVDRVSHPPDPLSDITWSAGLNGVDDVQVAFNEARQTENAQLGTAISMLTMPSQSEWDALSDGEKALWLINRERVDRGIHPLHGLEENVTAVAQNYAQYLIDNETLGHCEDGRTPFERLEDNPAIADCHDFLTIVENLALFWTSGSSIPLPIERSVFMWIYEDEACGWLHRRAVLWYPYNDNSGLPGMEGFLGIGRASGPHQGWHFGEIIVMNVFDPCSNWVYDNFSPERPTVSTAPVDHITQTSATVGGNVSCEGGSPVTARGVCWSTEPTPTTADGKTVDGPGAGTFSSTISGLSRNTMYYIRAYATNAVGTAYGETHSFKTATVAKADVDNSGQVDLIDAIAALRIAAGMPLGIGVFKEADVDGDHRIGVSEAAGALQRISNR